MLNNKMFILSLKKK